MKKSNTITIFHPKTKELRGQIITLEMDSTVKAAGLQFESRALGFTDWHSTVEEAETSILETLQDEYSGSAGKERAEDRAYSMQERGHLFI